jgi:hypothetical protein
MRRCVFESILGLMTIVLVAIAGCFFHARALVRTME